MKNFVLNISFRGANIRRKVAVPFSYGFYELHKIVQIVFGWSDECIFEFHTARFIVVDDLDETAMDNKPCSCVCMNEVLRREKHIRYVYDLDDDLTLDIEVESVDVDGEDFPVLVEARGGMLKEGDISDILPNGSAPADIPALNALLKNV